MKLLDVVALAVDLPQEHLVRGQVGTIVETLAPHVFLVEFADLDGKAYAIVPTQEDQLIELRHAPAMAA